jgi:hypothetical protein
MSYKSSRELAREKIDRAEAALEEYVRSGEGDCEHHKFLISAVTMARCEFVEVLALLWPTEVSFDPKP